MLPKHLKVVNQLASLKLLLKGGKLLLLCDCLSGAAPVTQQPRDVMKDKNQAMMIVLRDRSVTAANRQAWVEICTCPLSLVRSQQLPVNCFENPSCALHAEPAVQQVDIYTCQLHFACPHQPLIDISCATVCMAGRNCSLQCSEQ